MLQTYLNGELPQVNAGLLSEHLTTYNTIDTGLQALKFIRGSALMQKSSEGYYGNKYSLEKPISILLPDYPDPIDAKIHVIASRIFRHNIDNFGINTERVMLPRLNPAIIAVGASVKFDGHKTISAVASPLNRGHENIPGLDNLRDNVKNQIPVEFHRISFINSVVKAIQKPTNQSTN